MMNSRTSLEYLLEGFDLSNFLNECYGNKYVHISRSDSSFYEGIFDIVRFDNLINDNILSTKYLKISKLGSIVDKTAYSIYDDFNKEYQINIGKLLNFLSDGYTIVLDDVAKNDRNILDLEIDISKNVRYVDNISTNAYLTPAQSQAFPMHYDIQDVFILQIFGSKKWEIFPNIDNTFPIDFSHDSIIDDIKTKGLRGTSLNLKPGDLLYIPRGMVHEVSTTDEPSLHLTISVVNFTIFNLLEKSFLNLKNKDIYFRKNLSTHIDVSEYKKHLLSFIDDFDFEKVANALTNKNKYSSLSNYKETLLYNLNLLSVNKEFFSFRNGVEIFTTDNSETIINYGDRTVTLEGDFTFLKEVDLFDVNIINKFLENTALSNELVSYLAFEGFISKAVNNMK